MYLLHFLVFFAILTFVQFKVFAIMATWLDLMTRCEGNCYYFPDDSPGILNHECRNFVFGPAGRPDSQGSVFISPVPCRYAVSIQPYIPACETFDRQPLNDRLCEYYNHKNESNLYQITVARRYDTQGCDLQLGRNPPYTVDNYKTEFLKNENPATQSSACNVWDENVAFTLSPSQETNLTAKYAAPDKLYYVCTNEGITSYPYYVGRHAETDNGLTIPAYASRITLAEPYADNPPGILWSRVRKPIGERTIICSVILATDKFPYRISQWNVELTGEKETFRHEILAAELRPQFIHLAPDATNLWIKVGIATITRYYFPKEHFRIFDANDPDLPGKEYRKYTKVIKYVTIDNVQHSSNTINLKALVAGNNTKSIRPPVDPVINANVLKKIDAIYATCRDKRAMCFNFPWEEGCQSREKCHMLVVIEQLFNFERLHVDLLTHPYTPHPVVMPYSYGWMGLAFSNDARMGGEAVFTCGYKGRVLACGEADRIRSEADKRKGTGRACSKVYISINLEHIGLREAGIEEKNNYFAGDQYDPLIGDYQQLIENPTIDFNEVPSESEARVLCSFDIRTRDYTNISVYPKRPHEVLRYDLINKEYYVLIATGQSVVGDWQISYHGKGSRAAGSTMKFSRKIYQKTVKSSGLRSHAHV